MTIAVDMGRKATKTNKTNHHYDPMIKAEDFKWLDRVYHLFHLGSYLCLSGALTDCFLPLTKTKVSLRYVDFRVIQLLLVKSLRCV